MPDGPGDNLINKISLGNFLNRNLSKEKNILRRLLQSKIGKVRPYSNTPVGRGNPGPERIQVAYGKFPLRARWERHACKEDFL